MFQCWYLGHELFDVQFVMVARVSAYSLEDLGSNHYPVMKLSE